MKRHDVSDQPIVYLKPGELFIGHSPTKVVTILGSCVSVTLYSPRLRIGAVCHATLPHCRHIKDCRELCDRIFMYMDCSIQYMILRFRQSGVLPLETEVKMFGGADTFGSKKENSIGSMNVRKALEIIKRENLRIIAADIGDSFGRKLIFYTDTGEAYLKRLKQGPNAIQKPGLTIKMRGR